MKYEKQRGNFTGRIGNALIIMGPPFIGKGTQCKMLADGNPDIFHFSSGDYLRQLKTDPKQRQYIDSLLAGGKFIPPDKMEGLFRRGIDTSINVGAYNPLEQVIASDGTPRSIEQVGWFNGMFDVIGVICYEAGHETLLKRFRSRQAGGRSDDALEAVAVGRINEYITQTLPVADAYPRHVVRRIDAEGAKNEVYALTMKAIDELGVLVPSR